MNRSKIARLLLAAVSIIFGLLLLSRLLGSGTELQAGGLLGGAAAPLMQELQNELQQLSTAAAVPSPEATMAALLTQQTLPRDPFTFQPPEALQLLPQQDHQLVAPTLPATVVEPPPPPPVEEQFHLQATAIDRYGKLAIINDQALTEGQSVLGYTIVRIAAGHVVMTQEDKTIHLRLHQGGKS